MLFSAVMRELRKGGTVMVYGDRKGSSERFVGWVAREYEAQATRIGDRVYLWGGCVQFDEGGSSTFWSRYWG